ncbi:DUF4230 domain-containing protein [Bacillus sp. Marseille-P3661]|uniref:DUF4230 domain-containing protein n=1 Tax=Bacillus sp. Marseille-P3661 TaxID=1936234 RepID=UPI000C85C153|nr:DUF4230 domain-containing protein [Bacillus sp. Marseille-P3661]
MKSIVQFPNFEKYMIQRSFLAKIKQKWRLLIIGSLGFAVILSLLLLLFPSFFNTADIKHGEIVESIQELAILATAEAHVKTVIEQEDNEIFGKEIPYNIPGTQRHLLLIVPATIIAGVDLKNINENNIQFNDKKNELTINLPKATVLQEPSINMSEVKAFSTEGIFRDKVDWEEGFELAALAKQQIKEEALAMGLLSHAETNTIKTLQQFFESTGYKVNVHFQ